MHCLTDYCHFFTRLIYGVWIILKKNMYSSNMAVLNYFHPFVNQACFNSSPLHAIILIFT